MILSSYIFLFISLLIWASFKLKIKRTNNCPKNAFVDATPISGPAWIGKTQSEFLAIVLSTTFTIEHVFTLFFLQISKAAAVSAVSPDCDTNI